MLRFSIVLTYFKSDVAVWAGRARPNAGRWGPDFGLVYKQFGDMSKFYNSPCVVTPVYVKLLVTFPSSPLSVTAASISVIVRQLAAISFILLQLPT